ncbi:hypothetical protein GCK72_020194 [Caenorhabditis remanei]|uniref:Carboxylic ester hydrolase n=1 Tax=Caenorhabditis remanei TaxID=31234 RepID=A0A6A5GEG7_CAERE|nr:hypothetical protein GCK72_020194 [Caenorhabditis remanei]KAF1753637.1 hypothetical protein GCK72_020194 [Caenorhabditis remanei]
MGGHLSHLEREVHPEKLDASCGPIRGNIYKHDDKIVDGYLGIPYAKPPVGELRFKKPVPAGVWTETKDCTKYGPRCPQSGAFPEMIKFEKPDIPDEANCLTLNVFAPRWESQEFGNKRPVMIYVHGGGFELSASRDYCDYSVSGTLPLKDVIMVTINYRVGILGFFTTGDDECRGNFGLWDQTLALKWVQRHISSFGGDPNNVTVFGQSAGGVSVDLLSLSPHSRDLFHKVVPMSGNALTEFACRTPKNEAKACIEYLRHIGYTGSKDSKEILNWLKNKPIEEMDKLSGYQLPITGYFIYQPNLDGDFLPKPLDELRKEAPKKSGMVGVAEHEGLFFSLTGDPRPADVILTEMIWASYKEDTGEKFEETRKRVYEFYTKGVKHGDEKKMKERLVDFLGDTIFNGGAIATAQASLKYGNNVWLYVFDYVNPSGFGGLEEMMPFVGPTHCTDLRYVLGEGLYSEFKPDEADWKMIDKMTTMYTNFAKYGNPNGKGPVEWEPYSLETPERHYRIGYPRGEMRDEYHKGRWAFMKEIRDSNKILEEVIYGR